MHARSFRPALLAVASVLMAPIAAAQPAVEREAEIERGRGLAAHLCATCHLNPGQGEKSAASSIPGFTAVANRPGQTAEGIMEWLRSVPTMMPNHRLTQDEMSAIAAYILTLAVQPIGAEEKWQLRP